jgi:hypothetical protein
VHTAVLDRLRSSSVVPADRVAGVEPVEWVELSNLGALDGEDADSARVATLRREIAAGTYITDHKLDIVVGKLIDILHAPR